jgi:hypothetical protein
MHAPRIRNVKSRRLLTASLLVVALALNALAQGEPRYAPSELTANYTA